MERRHTKRSCPGGAPLASLRSGATVGLVTSCYLADSVSMNKVLPLILLNLGLTLVPAVARAQPRTFLLDAKQLQATRERIRTGDQTLIPALEKLDREAQQTLKGGTYSVTSKQITPPSGDKHDYMSQAPYFWPDPSKPGGLPYLRRDGERNPEIN